MCVAICQVPGPRHFGERRLGKRSTFGDAFNLRKHDLPQGVRPGTAARVRGGYHSSLPATRSTNWLCSNRSSGPNVEILPGTVAEYFEAVARAAVIPA